MRIIIMALALALALALGLAGCGGEEANNQKPTDRSIPFRLYPSNFWDSDYQENYSISGTAKRSDTVSVTGSLKSKSNGLASVNSVQAQSVYSTMTTKETSTGALITASSTGYYSTDANQMRYLGSLSNGVYTTARSNSIIPLTAKIGDFGSIGQYVNSADSNIENLGWELQDGYNGNAKFIITNSEYSGYGDATLVRSSVESYLITPDGNRLSMNYDDTNHQEGIIIKVSGDRE